MVSVFYFTLIPMVFSMGLAQIQVLTAFIEIDSMFVVQYENIAQTQSSCGLPVHELLFEYIQCQWGQVHGQEIDTVFVNDQK